MDPVDVSNWQSQLKKGLLDTVILNLLARVPGLQVAARTSSFAYKGREVDVRQIGRELGVETVSSTPEQFGVFMARENERWSKLIKEANIQPE